MMKYLSYCILLLTALSFGCSENEDPSTTPFSLLPDSLQKEIEQEVLEEMQMETIDYMKAQNQYYRSSIVPGCDLIDERYWLRLTKVNNEIVKIRGEAEQIASIRKKVFLFYIANEGLNSDQTDKHIQNPDYEFYNYPFYSIASRDQIKSELEKSQTLVQLATTHDDSDLQKFHQRFSEDLNNKLTALNTLNVENLKSLHRHAHIIIKDQTQESGLSSLTVEALHGMLDVRNWAAKKYFCESYLSLYFKATRYYDDDANKKIQAIKTLFKLEISDHNFADSKGLLWNWNTNYPSEEI